MVWQGKTLNKIGNIFSGNSINAKTKNDLFLNIDSGMPYVATKDVSYDSIIDYDNGVKIPDNELANFRIAHKNSILICAEGGSAGRKLAFNTQDICFVNKLFALEPSDFMEPRYVFYFYHTSDFQEQFKSKITGLIGGVSMGKFKEIKIPVPPLSIQKQIVSILDEVFEKISKTKENSEQNLKNAKEVFESYLQSIFENKGEGWKEKRLGQILDIERGGSPRPIQKYLTKDTNGINWIKIGDTKNVDKYISKTNQKIKPEGLKKSRLVIEGDFILSNSMSFGKPYIMKTTGAIHDGWLVLREKDDSLIDKNYLYNILNSPYVFNQFDYLAAGSTVRNLNISLVSSVKIPVPSMSIQKEIVSKLDKFSLETNKLSSIYTQKLSSLEELRQSILQKAFKGELTEVSA